MKKDLFALKGTICYSKNQKELVFAENSYAVCENGLCAGVFSQLPEEYKDIPVKDMGDRLIIPGFHRPSSACSPVRLPRNRHGSRAAGLAEHHHFPAGSQVR